jgi:acyl carrier protein
VILLDRDIVREIFQVTLAMRSALTNQVISLIQNSVVFGNLPIQADSRLAEDLGLDSMDVTEVVLHLEEVFQTEFAAEAVSGFDRVDDIVNYLSERGFSAATRTLH